MTESNIIIIGGGIVGTSAAYYLSKSGAAVTVIDKAEIGYGCSYGNAGWIVPAHAVPLPAPGAVKQGLKWMFNPDSPLYIKPRFSSSLISWLYKFMRYANQSHMEKGAKSLMALASESLKLYTEFDSEHPDLDLGFHQRGLLQVSKSEKTLAGIKNEARLAEKSGLKHEYMSAEKIREFEPALQGDFLGGAFLPDSADAEPLATVKALQAAAEKQGAKFLPNTEVFDIERSGKKITALQTTEGKFSADNYILATGSWSGQWAKTLNINIPIQGGKGYALILEPIDPMPRGPILLNDYKVAITPRKDSLRLAGTMEINGLNESITTRRVEAIIKGAKAHLNIADNPKIKQVWRGLRPCAPDGLPIIGNPKHLDNLTIATGHAMLGLTMGAGSGKLISDYLNRADLALDIEPFSPNRF